MHHPLVLHSMGNIMESMTCLVDLGVARDPSQREGAMDIRQVKDGNTGTASCVGSEIWTSTSSHGNPGRDGRK